MKPNNVIYDSIFFHNEKALSESASKRIVPLVMKCVQPSSVVDVGCGVGSFLNYFSQYGVQRILGIDGDWVPKDQLEISISNFSSKSLNSYFKLDESFDMAVCLEVGEHLEKNSAGSLVKTLVDLAPVVLFSAAVPHQGGDSHINEMWPCKWANYFLKHDYVCIDYIRPLIWNDSSIPWWYRQNIMLYVRRSNLHLYPFLKEYYDKFENTDFKPLSLIHPDCYLHLKLNPTQYGIRSSFLLFLSTVRNWFKKKF